MPVLTARSTGMFDEVVDFLSLSDYRRPWKLCSCLALTPPSTSCVCPRKLGEFCCHRREPMKLGQCPTLELGTIGLFWAYWDQTGGRGPLCHQLTFNELTPVPRYPELQDHKMNKQKSFPSRDPQLGLRQLRLKGTCVCVYMCTQYKYEITYSVKCDVKYNWYCINYQQYRKYRMFWFTFGVSVLPGRIKVGFPKEIILKLDFGYQKSLIKL